VVKGYNSFINRQDRNVKQKKFIFEVRRRGAGENFTNWEDKIREIQGTVG
jgi:hypothetical protein